MGTIPDPNYDEGLACSACFGSGKTFGDVSTPETVKVILADILPCPLGGAAPNGVYILPQSTACVWEVYSGDWLIRYSSYVIFEGSPIARLLAYDGINSCFGFESRAAICTVDFTNDWGLGDCAADLCGYSGSGEVSWGPEI